MYLSMVARYLTEMSKIALEFGDRFLRQDHRQA
jgi:hypothetical protein